MEAPRETPQGWAVLELMGHRRLGGLVSEAELAGAKLIRIDVPGRDAAGAPNMTTQFYSPTALYCLTPTTEEVARAVASYNRVVPVHAYEVRRIAAPAHDGDGLEGDGDTGREFDGGE